ncbi:bifunctional hydroxymethylpyrimidine kinase/phosphomethylpyrimidine kinase [Xylophilus sp. GOD-11R]|uniref:bifunctional hydroxymethylpyrimidine kinase/phosphomethylpyrimidine kinase n=1 Tax=Xylophilus sp. GOD-11R TaxID=3089814 RepID=UPI00298C2436|nr:bifunctional hydroxymethylpyrimidine kinase/phosphomethylpyrimidine kinase [Xylophilus sp. GOD-11R]WPB57988.1 bifunctional hydroxymethylpyrimidine kinase/phosphomethylpyrimidine kinase [Xylophilus sp. GOD-11R]
MTAPPIVWTVAGTDSGGGAGIAADQRAADACGVHLCTLVTAVTAQNSRGVQRIDLLPTATLEAQFAALQDDMPPAAIKTGLLGGPQQVACVAHWVDRLRARAPVALVVDPVLSASTGAAFADDATLAACRALLLPRASLVTPNRREAARLAGLPDDTPSPTLAAALRARGAASVCVTGGDEPATDGLALDWVASPQADGWLALPRIDTPHHHGTGCTFATAAASALARGFVAADALVLAKMATASALRHGAAAGHGAGPVRARAGFVSDASLMPQMSWCAAPRFAPFIAPGFAATPPPALGLYAIVDRAERVAQVVEAGVRTVQLRIKSPSRPAAGWMNPLRDEIAAATACCRAAGAMLFVNDHHALAVAAGAPGVHLGQEDIALLDDAGRAALVAPGAPALGVSAHSLWELARARSLAPRYIACGPVWPTLTKRMPWRPQGLHNLAWWTAMAGAPVVAIGGILTADRARQAAGTGADGICVVRGLGERPAQTVPGLQAALAQARAEAHRKAPDGRDRPDWPDWPTPSL